MTLHTRRKVPAQAKAFTCWKHTRTRTHESIKLSSIRSRCVSQNKYQMERTLSETVSRASTPRRRTRLESPVWLLGLNLTGGERSGGCSCGLWQLTQLPVWACKWVSDAAEQLSGQEEGGSDADVSTIYRNPWSESGREYSRARDGKICGKARVMRI